MDEIVYVKTLEDYEHYVKYLEDYDSLGMDTETYIPIEIKHLGYTALDCHAAKVSLLQIIGHKPKENTLGLSEPFYMEVNELSEIIIFDLILLNKLNYDKTPIINLLKNARFIVGVNIQFDLKSLYTEFNMFFENSVCLRAMSLLIGNATGSKFNKLLGNSYKSLCKNYLNVHLEQKGEGSDQTTDWYTRPSNEFEETKFRKKLEYAGTDVKYLFPIWVLLYNTICLPLLSSPLLDTEGTEDNCGLGMYQVYLIEMRVISVIAEMEYNGFHINKSLIESIEEANREKLREVTIKLADYLDIPLPINRFTNEKEINEEIINILNSPKKLILIINKLLGTKILNTTSIVIRRTSSILEKIYENFSNSGSYNQDEDEPENKDEVDSELFVNDGEANFFKDLINRDDLVNVSYILNLILEYKQISKQLSQSLIPFINPYYIKWGFTKAILCRKLSKRGTS